ncbi:hypothetical protein K504DRAFT_424084 [Pleomassaria siparia CBS 279.74]|uniref:WW domain-containing protein n=1 Tax=Pleomassaria siparia CBS 279.74 TaxID=1314801 RepID=A0A6G1KM32_9PLEO|nr:hypothetical protein K504DRAFT_424084 [Pleomassaria siparia CBS 279.74]
MADIPVRPPAGLPALAPGWTEHSAPSGHVYYYNKETKKSTYVRPIVEIHGLQQQHAAPRPPAPQAPFGANPNIGHVNHVASNNQLNPNFQPPNFRFGGPAQEPFQNAPQHSNPRGDHRGGHRGGFNNFQDRRRQPEDKPKHRSDIPNCAPWVLVKTKLGRRFVWNKDTNESFWKFPPHVMKAVMDFDHKEREKKERREHGQPSDEEDTAMAEVEADLAAVEEEMEKQIVRVDGEVGMDDDSEYEEVEVTDDEGEEANKPPKRQRTEEPTEDQAMEMGEDDIAWQLAQMEAMEEGDFDEEDEEEGLPLTEEDCKALFKELLDDTRISPYVPWDKVLENDGLYEDERYKALPTMKARKDCFDEWARERIHYLKEQKANQQTLDPRIPYLALLHKYATPKLYWPEFRRKYKREMKDSKVTDKVKEQLYRDHIKRLGLKQPELRSDLSNLLKAQPLALLNGSTTLETLPPSILTDLRFISLPASTRDSLVGAYISTLPPAPEGAFASAEEEAEVIRKRAERGRRERALAERERRVQEDRRKQERDLAYGMGRLREEEAEIERAMKFGKDGLKGQLGS